MTEPLERQLDSFDPRQRAEVLSILWREAQKPGRVVPLPGPAINLHAHTFFSYNAYGYSPSKYAWLARRAGLSVAGIVDFDTLDGIEEFHEAGRLLGLKTTASVETRVFLPEFASRVVNSPGEPGILYHMGVGFTKKPDHPFLKRMRDAAQKRVREMISHVNAYLNPVEIDFDRDVIPLTPNGNATERHLCEAYERKAVQLITNSEQRAAYWIKKLGHTAAAGADLQGLIRAKTMKRGGPGYTKPDSGLFPSMADMNAFVLDCGAIPTFAWLDGMSEGERHIEELLDIAQSIGTAALNIIPDRNYRPGVKDQKLANFKRIVEIAEGRDFPIIVGTEMNAPGNKFVDSFDTEELKAYLPVFRKGAHIVYGHTALQRHCGLGYLSNWSRERFASVADKNVFFEKLGRTLSPQKEDVLKSLPGNPSPSDVLAKVS